ncbi:hypothetical protein GW17_00001357 [Ensete ventricosum]|nr:hypothetical protein GW17_00001357 [Ensete ventricosum]
MSLTEEWLVEVGLNPASRGMPCLFTRVSLSDFLTHDWLCRDDLYTLSSEVLMDGASKAMVLTTLFDRVHDAGRVITSLDGKVNLLRQELQDLKEGGNPDVVVVAEVRATETQSLVEHLRVELDEANDRRTLGRGISGDGSGPTPRCEGPSAPNGDKAVGFGSIQGCSSGGATEEGDRRLQEVARVQDGLNADGAGVAGVWVSVGASSSSGPTSWVEIELDPFVSLPEDDDVPMADEQPFDDSLLPPEE